MRRDLKAAVIQMVSTPEVAENLACAAYWLREVARQGAQLAILPEYFALIGWSDRDKFRHAEPFGDGPLQAFLRQQAKQHGLWLVGGSLPLTSPDPERVFNSLLVYTPEGELAGRYDKIHLFGFEQGEERYREADTIAAGDTPVVIDTPWGRLGLAICYDLRFPELFRSMGELDFIALPAAFTATTGQAHWEILLRARAIENQCHVLAAAQGGRHASGRQTHGQSLIIDPWGRILDDIAQGEGFALATLEAAKTLDIRQRLPALRHRRL